MKYIDTRKYSYEGFLRNFQQATTAKDVEELIAWYLKQVKAHPAFVARAFFCWVSAKHTTQTTLLNAAKKTFRKLGFAKYSDFNKRVVTLGNLYNDDGVIIPGTDEGILEALLIEAYWAFAINLIKPDFDVRKEEKLLMRAYQLIINHPSATLQVLDTAVYLASRARASSVEAGKPSFIDRNLESAFTQTTRRFLTSLTAYVLASRMADVWDREDLAFNWSLFDLIFNLPLPKMCSDQNLLITPLFEAMFQIAESGTNRLNRAAQQIIQFVPFLQSDSSQDDEAVSLANMEMGRIAQGLKGELPNPSTHQLLIRWLQYLGNDLRALFLMALVGNVENGVAVMDDRVQYLLEEVLGMDTWKLLCKIWGPEYWYNTPDTPSELARVSGMVERGQLKFDDPEVISLFAGFLDVPWHKHAYKPCVAIEQLVQTSGITPLEVDTLKTQRLYLLSEEVIRAVTHSYTHLTILRRQKTEFLGAELPKVSLAELSDDRQYGSSCKFQVFLRNHDLPLSGTMDDDGHVNFDNVLYLSPLAVKAIEAVVVDSLCQILVPRLVETLPQTGKPGCRIPATTDVYAARPTIHTLGDLENRQHYSDEVSGGTRINPEIATKVFEWLLGMREGGQFRLYQAATIKHQGRKESYFCTDHDAHEQIMYRHLSLHDVYMRIVRAHTKPLGVRFDSYDNIVVQQRSAKAERNYDRYLRDIGRKLDFSDVRKTYTLPGPDKRKMVLDIPRTFNQGAFCTLAEAWEYVLDLNVKAQAYQMFKF
jgi:hypothetical protein